jgi:ATP-dependent Lon protease
MKKANSTKSTKNKLCLKDKPTNDLQNFIIEKNTYLQEIIKNTIISIRNNNQREIFSNNDTILSISLLAESYQKTKEIHKKVKSSTTQKEYDNLIEALQAVIDKLSMIICGFGTKNIEDLLFICFGTEFKELNIQDPVIKEKYELIKQHICPIGYKIIKWKTTQRKIVTIQPTICSNKIVEDIQNIEDSQILECFDTEQSNKTLFQKTFELRIAIPNETLKKTIIIYGIAEDVQIDYFNNKYIETRKEEILNNISHYSPEETEVIHNLLNIINIKDILVYGTEDIFKKMNAVFTEINNVKKNSLDITINKFTELDPYSQRNMIINLLLYSKDDEIQYICYLLYEIITFNNIDSNDSNEQKNIYESLPQPIKKHFKDIVKCNIKLTNENIQKYEKKNISFEQQIHLLKAPDSVKEKALFKLKEIKGKTEESGNKAKQYLEGLLKIPFGIYREEPILKIIKEFNHVFENISTNIQKLFPSIQITKKSNYTTIEIMKYLKQIELYVDANVLEYLKLNLENKTIKEISNITKYIQLNNNKEKKFVSQKTTNKTTKLKSIIDYLKDNNTTYTYEIFDKIQKGLCPSQYLNKIMIELQTLKTNMKTIECNIKTVKNVLDESIYGHSHAKNQLMKVISQWMSGEQNGYCFGFEGSPGIGKTSLAKKGLSCCLKNAENVNRPFAFIALGGSSNASFLEGHGYTYINSSWGKITDILIQTKCMNPIIYIDELDKVSKTENGKEIIGILTHIIDQTQNDIFQDKYFNGIDIDLSKVLFIFSYNDPEQIDKVLLDRIHRIKFDNLSLSDKIVIVKKYILPEINKKMGFDNVVQLSDEIIEYVIETYTAEPGVRKLKEVIFDLFGEVNIEILENSNNDSFDIPIKITKENLENKYLIKYCKRKEKKIHEYAEIGVINGLWANSLGLGGIIPIESHFFPSSTFLDLKLTGLQGDVMKESMNVAKTLAWKMTDENNQKRILEGFESNKCYGLHIHCPEGAVPKDGPSAGTAITVAIYSLLNGKKIRNDVAITGEINLRGEVTSIGGLDAKIAGGISAGIKTFIFPKSNNKDFLEWKEKNGKNVEEIRFVEVSTIEEVFEIIFVE